jgi:hypothetical protein
MYNKSVRIFHYLLNSQKMLAMIPPFSAREVQLRDTSPQLAGTFKSEQFLQYEGMS